MTSLGHLWENMVKVAVEEFCSRALLERCQAWITVPAFLIFSPRRSKLTPDSLGLALSQP